MQEFPFAFKRTYKDEIELVNNMLKESEYLLSIYNQELAEYDKNFEYIKTYLHLFNYETRYIIY